MAGNDWKRRLDELQNNWRGFADRLRTPKGDVATEASAQTYMACALALQMEVDCIEYGNEIGAPLWTLVEIDDVDQVFLTQCWTRADLLRAVGEGSFNDGREYEDCEECNGIADILIDRGVFDFEGDRPLYLHATK